MWFYAHTNPGAARIIDKEDIGGVKENLYLAVTNLQYQVGFSISNGIWNFAVPALNAWHHCAFSYDNSSTTNNPVPVVDGVIQTPGAVAPSGVPTTTTNAFAFGNLPNGTKPWNGMLADFALWNVLLTTNEMIALSTGVRPPKIRPQSLVGYWPLDGIESPEQDLSGGKFNGTVTGALKQFGPPISLLTRQQPSESTLYYGWPTPVTVVLQGFGRA